MIVWVQGVAGMQVSLELPLHCSMVCGTAWKSSSYTLPAVSVMREGPGAYLLVLNLSEQPTEQEFELPREVLPLQKLRRNSCKCFNHSCRVIMRNIGRRMGLIALFFAP